tara:strand:+ start:1405 stop:1617 length:213 start_codon:yes stop_codon:yes gene_type:complete
MMQAIYDFLESNEQYGDDWTEAKAWLKETSLKLQKLGWIENSPEVCEYISTLERHHQEFYGEKLPWNKED